jgi:RecJ-like exonuclease
MTDTPSRPAPQQACPECFGKKRIEMSDGVSSHECEFCNGTGKAPQQEQAARFVVTDDADIFDSETKRVIHVPGRDLMAVRDYARAIAAALNASPPKEAK